MSRIVLVAPGSGADFVEIQIPFPDPIADGPVIMGANTQALKNGITMKDCFDVARELSKRVGIPLLFMGYFSTVFIADLVAVGSTIISCIETCGVEGVESFVRSLASAGGK